MGLIKRIISSVAGHRPKSNASHPLLKGRTTGGASFFASGYDIVDAPYDLQRRQATVETKSEDGILTANKRLKLTALMRDMLRNSPLRAHIDQQWRVNVVGSIGGRMYASFPKGYEQAAEEVMHYFNSEWFPRAEFTFRNNFNWLLKTCLTSMDDGGNVVLVFDDGILTGGRGTGRIRAFEGDEIADVERFEKFYGAGYSQSQGFVYNPAGMFCGCFLSTHQRGRPQFDPTKGVISLRRDPFDDDALCNWAVLGDMRRFNQGRAVSPLASALATIIDANEANTNERLASKYNAQMIAALEATDPDMEVESDYSGAANPTGMPGIDPGAVTADFSPLRRNAIAYQKVPYGMKLNMLDTRHPNDAMDAFLERLAGNAGGVKGLGRFYSTGRVQQSYTAFQGEQLMSWASFEEAQKDLERNVCDWAARCVISRAVRLGHVLSPLPDGWESMIAWQWPKMRQVSEKDALAAIEAKMKLGLTTRQRLLNPGDDLAIQAERAAEKEADDAAGFIYPGTQSVSGQIKEPVEPAENNDETEKMQ